MIRACVLRAPGTNCDEETAYAFEAAGATAERVHLFQLLEQPELLKQFQILCIPGGFSYGDDIGAGVIFSRQLQGPLRETLGEFLAGDRLILGICNGFQVLLKAGLLPAGAGDWSAAAQQPAAGRAATLTWNENGRYTAVWVRLSAAGSNSVFLRGIEEIDLPVAHAEGRFVASDAAAPQRWHEAGQIACRYVPWSRCESEGDASTAQASQTVAMREEPLPWPANPNGTRWNIAGISDPTGRVLGLMPHPERYLFATQHPEWTRRRLSGDGEGLQLFRNAVDYFT